MGNKYLQKRIENNSLNQDDRYIEILQSKLEKSIALNKKLLWDYGIAETMRIEYGVMKELRNDLKEDLYKKIRQYKDEINKLTNNIKI